MDRFAHPVYLARSKDRRRWSLFLAGFFRPSTDQLRFLVVDRPLIRTVGHSLASYLARLYLWTILLLRLKIDGFLATELTLDVLHWGEHRPPGV